MSDFDNKNSIFIITDNASLEDAMVKITLNQRGAVIVVDDKGLLLGVVSDGDIRRAFLRHDTLITPITKVVNMNIVSIPNKKNVKEISKEIFDSQTAINIIPVVNDKNKVVNIIERNPGVRK